MAVGATMPGWQIQDRHRLRDLSPNSEITLPSCRTIVWLITDERLKRELRAVKDAEDQRYFIVTPSQPGSHFRIGRFQLATSDQPCGRAH
jgi:hypothetical protein